MEELKQKLHNMLRASEKYTKTDMVYLAKGGFWINLNYVVDSILSFTLVILFAYFISQETYGIYKYIISTTGILAAFSLTGMNLAVVRASAQNFDGIFRKSLIVQLRWSVIQFLMLCALGVYYFYKGNEILGTSFLIISILAPVSSIANTYGAYLQGKKHFATLSTYGILSSLFNFLIIGTAIIFIKNPVALVLIYYATRAVINTFFCLRTLQKFKPGNLFRSEDTRYGKHVSLMNIIGTIAAQIDNVIVFHYLGSASVAIYSFATVIPERLKGLFSFVGTAALSKMSEKKDFEIGKNIIQKIVVLIVIALVLIIVYIIVAPLLFSILFPKYIDSVLYSQFFAITIMAIAASIPIGALYAKKLQKELYILNILGPVMKIVIFIGAVYYFGLWGAIAARIFASFLHIIVPTWLLFGSTTTKQRAEI